MENKSHALAAGAFVLAVSAMFVALAMWLMRDTTNTVAYDFVTQSAVSGLQPQAAVRFKGVPVGKVSSISFDPATPGAVRVTMAVSPQAPIRKSTFATLAYQGVTGLSFVQLDDTEHSTEPLPKGPEGVPRIPLRPSVLGELSERATAVMDKLETATEAVVELLNPESRAALRRVLTEAGNAAHSVNQLALTADKTIKAQLDPAKTNVPALVRQATATLASVEATAREARSTVAVWGVAGKEVQTGMARVTGPGGVVERFGETAEHLSDHTLPRVQGLAREATRSAQRFDRLTGQLRENPQELIWGGGAVPPGPGEPGFVAPPRAAQP